MRCPVYLKAEVFAVALRRRVRFRNGSDGLEISSPPTS